MPSARSVRRAISFPIFAEPGWRLRWGCTRHWAAVLRPPHHDDKFLHVRLLREISSRPGGMLSAAITNKGGQHASPAGLFAVLVVLGRPCLCCDRRDPSLYRRGHA